MENRLRIGIVVLDFAPTVGGAEARAQKQARRLAELGHEVTIFTIRRQKSWSQTESMAGLPVVRIGGLYRRGGALRIGRLGMWPVILALLRTLWRRRNAYDIIHVYDYSPLVAAAAVVARQTGKPLVITFQNTGPTSEERSQLEATPRLMADALGDAPYLQLDSSYAAAMGHDVMRVNAIGGGALAYLVGRSKPIYQSLSSRSRDQLLSYGFAPEQVVLIGGSVDTEIFRPNSSCRPDPLMADRPIVCVARLEYGKGIDVLLHAWSRMMQTQAQSQQDLLPRLLLVGDGMIRPQLAHIARDLGISSSVEFLRERTDVLDLLQRAWGFVLPSRWEGMPNALLEAMACGLPCVATRVSGSEDIIDDGVNGLLVEPKSPPAMAEALNRIIHDVELATRLGAHGREKAVHTFGLQNVVQECETLYRRLLAERSGAPHRAVPRRGR
jgi:glycosyltransferase involved in cell wall biosynthesis